MGEITGKIARKYMAHFLDTSFAHKLESAVWGRIGKDLEEYNVELNPDTETKKNILGENSFVHNGYDVSSEADPNYCYVGDPLFEKLQEIVDNRYTDDNCKTYAMEVHLWNGTGTAYPAYVQECYVVPNSYGGDTSGYQIPYSVNYVGERIKGTYDPSTKKFTAETTTE